MKKILVLIIVICVYVGIGKITTEKSIIPKDAIRIRIIANSNSENDQNIKMNLKSELEPYLFNLIRDAHDSNEAKNIINNNLTDINDFIYSKIENDDYKINFGKNYFPEKEYKGIKYDEGYYDSLLITLGDGLGDNWWCVLFPPLCMIDASSSTDYEYKSFVIDVINKYVK